MLSIIIITIANLQENNSQCFLWITFCADMKWKACIKAVAKSAARKVESLCLARQFFSLELVLPIYKSSTHLCIVYFCHIWSAAIATYLEILDEIQMRICNVIGLDLASQIQLLSHWLNIAPLCLFYIHFHVQINFSLWFLDFKHSTNLAVRSLHFTVVDPSCNHKSYTNNFFSHT